MKIKLDENLGERGADLFRAAGHEVATVFEQQLTSAPDTQLIAACSAEGRCLVTLDLDFTNPFRFPPGHYAGIAVLRLPDKVSDPDIFMACRTLIDGLNRADITGKLWIIKGTRIREYRPVEPEQADDGT